MSSDQLCTAANCPINAEKGFQQCIIHLPKTRKSKDEVSRGLDAYRIQGQKKIFNGYLEEADFSGLLITMRNFTNCNLTNANFSGARLYKVGFDFSILDGVNCEEIIFERVDLRRIVSAKDIRLYHALYDGVLLPSEEVIGEACIYDTTNPRDPLKALDMYHGLTKTYRLNGNALIASLYYEKEMDIHRELSKGSQKLWLWVLWAICGYGERPMRTFMSFLTIIVGYAGLYVWDGGLNPSSGRFSEALYFSVVTFTSLGYGDISPVGFSRLLASTEALIGVFMISLFVVVFCRRMIR
jgi:hypothetical protein